jgi:DNA repair/transcription protein MET18/MMS19
MASNGGFEDLALQFVLSSADDACQKAADKIRSSANNRILVGQWVASINRWMPRADEGADEGDGDVISRSKALDFLAGTLAVLGKDILKSDQGTHLPGATSQRCDVLMRRQSNF